MSFFQRFFAIAVLVLLFQSVLTGLFVAERVRGQDRDTALTELDESSRLIYENFNNWKRALWQQLVTLEGSEPAGEIATRLSPKRTVDWIVQAREAGGPADVYSATGIPYPEGLGMNWESPERPQVSFSYRNETLVLRASRPLERPSGESVGIHLLKLVDGTFCRQLAIDAPGTATFLSSQGAFPGLPGVPSQIPFTQVLASQRGYARFIGERNELGERLNGSLRNAGTVISDAGVMPLYLAVLLDASWQDRRMQTIVNSLVLSSVMTIALSAALILFGSWTLTKPIVRLAGAMERVAEGDFSLRLEGGGGRETKTLFAGFNRMTSQLQQDVRERERHIDEITALTNTNETIFNSIGNGMISVDGERRILRINNAAAEILGRGEEDLAGHLLAEVPGAELRAHLMEIAEAVLRKKGRVASGLRRTNTGVYQIGGFFLRTPTSIDGPVLEGCLLIVDNVTEKVSLEERMVRAEKLSSLSILTAGVAHEINNPLSSITTNVQNLACEIDDPEQKRAIGYIQQETRRIRDIVGRLLEFAGNQGSQRAFADLNEEIRLVLATVRYSIPEDSRIEVKTELAEKLPSTTVPADELRQILLNLVTNALQAIDGRGGTLSVTTARRGEQLSLTVTDDGAGIPEDVRQRIFDPFFTTKPDGSGLGLSVVYGLLNRYGGSCRIHSIEGEGTTVELSLPQGSSYDG